MFSKFFKQCFIVLLQNFLCQIYSYVFYYFDAIINRIVFFTFSYILLSEYRSTIDFYILILYPFTFMKSLILIVFLQIPSDFLHRWLCLMTETIYFLLLMPLTSFSCLTILARTFSTMLNGTGESMSP